MDPICGQALYFFVAMLAGAPTSLALSHVGLKLVNTSRWRVAKKVLVTVAGAAVLFLPLTLVLMQLLKRFL